MASRTMASEYIALTVSTGFRLYILGILTTSNLESGNGVSHFCERVFFGFQNFFWLLKTFGRFGMFHMV